MKATLRMLAESSKLVKAVSFRDTHIDWVLDINGRTVRSTGGHDAGYSRESLILLEIAGAHARHHALVEPTFLIVDGLFGYQSRVAIDALERLQTTAEHAQIAVISNSPDVVENMSREWTLTALEEYRASDTHVHGCPVDFEIETTTTAPSAFD
jgi:hypothetical protein